MNVKRVEDVVRQHPFFRGLSPEHLALVGTCAGNIRFDADAYIYHRGEPADHFYLIETGRVALNVESIDQSAITLDTVEPGEVLGWSWLFPPYQWQFSARCSEPVKAYVFDAACIRRKCETDNALGYQLMKRFSGIMLERLQAARLQLLDMYGPGTDET